MTVSDQTVVTTLTFDATDNAIALATVGTGELWFVEELYIDDPNGALDGNVDFEIAIGADPVNESTSINIDYARSDSVTNLSNGTTLTLNSYATGGEVVALQTTQEPASGTVQLTLTARQVI